MADDPHFVDAFAAGMERFRRFLDADRVDPSAIRFPTLRRGVADPPATERSA
jgi:hypothetical protein